MKYNTTLYIGIDVSKDKNEICIKSNEGNECKRFRISNTKADLEKLYATIDKLESIICHYIRHSSEMGIVLSFTTPFKHMAIERWKFGRQKRIPSMPLSLLICCVFLSRLLQTKSVI